MEGRLRATRLLVFHWRRTKLFRSEDIFRLRKWLAQVGFGSSIAALNMSFCHLPVVVLVIDQGSMRTAISNVQPRIRARDAREE